MLISKLKKKSLLKAFVYMTSFSPFVINPLAQASAFTSMPEDIRRLFFQKLAEENRSDVYRLIQTSRENRRVGKKTLELLRENDPMTVRLGNNFLMFVDEVLGLNIINEIDSFCSQKAFSYFLDKADVVSYKNLWLEETIAAATENREPSYLSILSQQKGAILASFMQGKMHRQDLSKKELTKMAYSLLPSVSAFESAARNAAGAASEDAARNAAGSSSRAADEAAARNAARNAAWAAAWAATWSATWAVTGNVARNAAENAAENAAWDATWAGAYNAACDAANDEISLRNLTEPQAIGRLSYRVAEKVSLLYFLKEAHRILDASFQAAYSKLSETIADEQNIFSSGEKWEAFKTAHFGQLSDAQREFLNPWLLELDKLVAAIASA